MTQIQPRFKHKTLNHEKKTRTFSNEENNTMAEI